MQKFGPACEEQWSPKDPDDDTCRADAGGVGGYDILAPVLTQMVNVARIVGQNSLKDWRRIDWGTLRHERGQAMILRVDVRSRFAAALLVYLMCALFTPFSHAAPLGALKVRVVDDSSGRPVDAVALSLVGRDGVRHEAQGTAAGEVSFQALTAGLYEMVAAHPDYLTLRLPSVRVVEDRTSVERIRMQRAANVFEEVVVTGEAVSGNALNAVGTGFLDREALRSSAGSGSDVLRALDGLPGLFGDGEYSSFTVRGNGPRDNLILVDGIPFDQVVHFSDSFGDTDDEEGGGRYSVFAPNVVAGAEFYPGGWDAAYGGKAGSLLKLEVAEGNPEDEAYTARLDIAGVEAGYDGPSGLFDNTSVLLSARTYNFERLFEAVGLESIGAPKLTDVIAKTTTTFANSDKLNLLLIYAPESYIRDIDNVLASDEDEPGNYEDVDLVDVERDNRLLAAHWTTWVGTKGRLENRFYQRVFEERSAIGEAYPEQVDIGAPVSSIPVRENLLLSSRDETEWGWRLDYQSENTLGDYTIGMRITQLDAELQLDLQEPWIRYAFDQNDYREGPEQYYIELTPEFVNSEYRQTAVNYTGFVDQALSAGPLDFRLGIRYDYDAFSKQDLVGPRFATTWYWAANTRMTFTAGRYFQSPNLADRASDSTNNLLQQEVVDQASIGIDTRPWTDVEWRFEVYYQDLDNLVVSGDSVQGTYSNDGSGQSYGFDTALQRVFNNGWSADVKYSFSSAKIREGADAPEIDADYSRPHIFSIGGVWEVNNRWKLSSRWKWASGRPRDDYIIHDDVLGPGQPTRYSIEYTARNVERFDAFSALNLRVDYRRAFGGLAVIAFVDVINVLGSENPNTTDFNERTGQLEADEGAAIPLVGFRLEW